MRVIHLYLSYCNIYNLLSRKKSAKIHSIFRIYFKINTRCIKDYVHSKSKSFSKDIWDEGRVIATGGRTARAPCIFILSKLYQISWEIN